jgi:hypothetical protein
MLDSSTPPSLADICEKYDIESEKKASNMIITIKRRFRETLRRYIRSTVASESEMTGELQEIMQFFPKRAQHFQ